MPDCRGPGRNSATSAIMSSKQSGFRRLIKSFMPRDSSWKTAVVSERCSMSKLFLSSSGMAAISIGSSPVLARRALIISNAQSMIVRVRKPRKSNFTSPAYSTSFLSNWVTGCCPSASQYNGAKSVILVGAITTPPACLPALRVTPSSLRAMSISALTSSSAS
ncbi:hypothetical protein D3C71_1528720 [compost metagenome]